MNQMENEPVMIPYFVHEGEMARMERANKRWFVAFLVVLVMLVVDARSVWSGNG